MNRTQWIKFYITAKKFLEKDTPKEKEEDKDDVEKNRSAEMKGTEGSSNPFVD